MDVFFAPIEQARPAAERFAAQVAASFGHALEKIMLFGSLARGTYSIESDVDFVLVLPRYDYDMLMEIYGLAGEYMTRDNIFISMKVFTEEQFQMISRMRTSFYEEIEKDGITLWTRPQSA